MGDQLIDLVPVRVEQLHEHREQPRIEDEGVALGAVRVGHHAHTDGLGGGALLELKRGLEHVARGLRSQDGEADPSDAAPGGDGGVVGEDVGHRVDDAEQVRASMV